MYTNTDRERSGAQISVVATPRQQAAANSERDQKTSNQHLKSFLTQKAYNDYGESYP